MVQPIKLDENKALPVTLMRGWSGNLKTAISQRLSKIKIKLFNYARTATLVRKYSNVEKMQT